MYNQTPWDKASRDDKHFGDYYYYFNTYDALLPRKFYYTKFNTLFYYTLHLAPQLRSPISFLKKMVNDLNINN